VSASDLYVTYAEPWENHNHGFNMQAARKIVFNTWVKGSVSADQLLTEPQMWAQLDYSRIEAANISSDITCRVAQAGVAHGLLIWFDTLLTKRVGFSNAPGGGAKVYGSSFFPFLEPVELTLDDQVKVRIKADLVGDEYVWSWQTLVFK